MAIECAHCGARCDDGATRCPRCLRTTHLVPVPAATPRPSSRRRAPLLAAITTAVLAIATGTVLVLRSAPTPPRAPRSAPPTAAAEALHTGASLAPLVARLRAEGDPIARAARAADEVHRHRVATLAGEDDPVPPPRPPDTLWRVLATPGEQVTELDLARLVTALLRAAGDPRATVAERTAGLRDDEPRDPTGASGSFVALAGDHVVDSSQGRLTSAGQSPPRALTDPELAGAVSAQAALAAAAAGTRDLAIQYAHAAVEAWATSPTPLAARARVWLEVGATSGLSLADADLRAAIALRDDAPYHLHRARLLLLSDRLAEAATEVARARRMAPAWGTAALATLPLAAVLASLDAGATSGCAGLRAARAPWTDDAYALCADDTAPDLRAASAGRLLHGSRSALRIAFAAAHGAEGFAARLRPAQHREAARWLLLLGHPELAHGLLHPPDAGHR